jgi:hypothetical protein
MAGSLSQGIGSIAQQAPPGATEAFFMVFVVLLGVSLLATAVTAAGAWKMYAKAGQPGWAAVVPIYNIYVLVTEIADRDALWVLLSVFVPFAAIIPLIDVAEAFGKGAGYGLGLFFLGFVFFPLLGFGDAQYRGASGY